MIKVIDLNVSDIVGEFETEEEATQFIEENRDYNYYMEIQ